MALSLVAPSDVLAVMAVGPSFGMQASKICGMLYDQGLLLPAHGQVGLKDSGSHLYFVNDVGSGVGVHGLT